MFLKNTGWVPHGIPSTPHVELTYKPKLTLCKAKESKTVI